MRVRSLGQEDPLEEGNPLQDSCLENPMDRGAWWATVWGVAKRQTRLKRQSRHTRWGSHSRAPGVSPSGRRRGEPQTPTPSSLPCISSPDCPSSTDPAKRGRHESRAPRVCYPVALLFLFALTVSLYNQPQCSRRLFLAEERRGCVISHSYFKLIVLAPGIFIHF